MSHDAANLFRFERLSLWLIHRAAAQAPQALSERLEEEWLADLETRSSSTSRLRFAVGCLWATRVITRDYQPAMAGAATTMAGSRILSSALQNGFGRFSKRSSTFLVVVSLHLALFYLAFTSLSHTHSASAPKGMQFQPIDRPPVTEHPPEVPRPRVDAAVDFHAEIPKVMIPLDLPAESDWSVAQKAVDDSGSDPGGGVPLLQSPGAKRVAGGPGAGFPDPDDYYPSLSKPLGEEGAAAVQVCVNAGGRLIANPTIVASSGIARLDEAALRLAKAGSGHYRPETEDGHPLESCFPFRIRFKVKR